MSLTTRASLNRLMKIEEMDQNLLDLEAGLADRFTKAETDSRIEAIIGTAPANLDTLSEIAAQLQNDESAVAAIVTTLAQKADSTQVAADIEQARIKSITLSGSATGTATPDANGDISIAVSVGGDKVNSANNVSGNVEFKYGDGNYIVATVTGPFTPSFTEVPDSVKAYGLTLELYNGGTNVNWPNNITWVAGMPPTLKSAGLNLITLITRDGGATWIGSST